MKAAELEKYDHSLVVVTLRDGTKRTGRFDVTPEPDLYHVFPDPTRAGEIIGGWAEDLWAQDISSIEPRM